MNIAHEVICAPSLCGMRSVVAGGGGGCGCEDGDQARKLRVVGVQIRDGLERTLGGTRAADFSGRVGGRESRKKG
jgi:hypothetical protein